MPDSKAVCEIAGAITLGQFREYTKDMPDDVQLVPRFIPGNEPGDHEPGVRLLGIGNGDEHDEEPIVSLAVELFYLGKDDEDWDNEDGDEDDDWDDDDDDDEEEEDVHTR